MPTKTERGRALRIACSGALAVALAVLGIVVSAAAATAAPAAQRGHVVLVAVPDLRWTDLSVMPTLRALASRGAVAELSVRSEGESTRCGDGLLELSAGTRVPSGVASCSIDAPTLQRLRDRYRHDRYRSRVGLLGDSLGASAVAVRPPAGVALAGAAGPAHVVGTIRDALAAGSVIVVVDTGIYDGRSRTQSAGEVDSRLAVTLHALPPDTTVMVAGVSDGPRGGAHLHPLVISGPSWAHHALTSPTTGRSSYVQLFDLSATLVALSGGTEAPDGMSGRAVRLSSAPVMSIGSLVDADRHARRALSVGHPTFSALCGVLTGILALLLLAPRLAAWPARLLVGAPLATWLIQLVPWWRWPLPAYVVLLLALCAIGAAVTWWAATRSWRAAVLAVPAATAVVLLLDQLAGARLQLAAPFGDNPLVAGRFHGMGNIAFGVTMSALLLALGVLAAHRPRRVVLAIVAGTALVAVVVDGAPTLGDDIGGVVTLVPAVAVLAALLLGVRVSWPRVLVVAGLAVGLAIGLGLIDYARPEDHQTHAGRFVGDVLHGRAWTTLHRKADAVVNSLATPAVTLLVVAVAVLAVLCWRRRVACPEAWRAELAAPAAAVAVLAVVGSLLNDSGLFVAAAALLATVPAAVAASPNRSDLGDTRTL